MAGKRAHLALRAGEPHEPRAAASAQAPAPSQGDLEPDREGEAEGVHADPPAHVLLAEPCEGRGRPGTWQLRPAIEVKKVLTTFVGWLHVAITPHPEGSVA